MNEAKDLKWFEFVQNNSGGIFLVDDKVCHRLYIEAESFNDAIKKAEELGCYWDGVKKGIDCPCCGDRWYKYDDEPINLELYKTEGYTLWGKTLYFNNIEEYAQCIVDIYGWTAPDARIYYNNGIVKEIFKTKVKY